LNLEIKSFL